MIEEVHVKSIDLLLRSIDRDGDFPISSFMYGKPGASMHDRRFGAELRVDHKLYMKALLFIRNNGPSYLREISFSDLWSMVTNFLTENYWFVGGGFFLSPPVGSFDGHVSADNKSALATALAASPMFAPCSALTLFPLLTVTVEQNFECEQFFLVRADQLTHAHLRIEPRGNRLQPENFPPFADFKMPPRSVVSWLGVRSPLSQISKKIAAVILGSISLTPLPILRHQFSGRQIFGGQCLIDGSVSITPSQRSHTPPISNDIVISRADHQWLSDVSGLINSSETLMDRKCRALEYFYRSWFLDPRERFPTLAMALDSLVAATTDYTTAAIEYVKKTVGCPIDGARLRRLMRIRGAVIHGAAPDVYGSTNYAQYYTDYGADPIFDLELVIARCLRKDVFDDRLQYHAHPYQLQMDEFRKRKRIAKDFAPASIIAMDE